MNYYCKKQHIYHTLLFKFVCQFKIKNIIYLRMKSFPPCVPHTGLLENFQLFDPNYLYFILITNEMFKICTSKKSKCLKINALFDFICHIYCVSC